VESEKETGAFSNNPGTLLSLIQCFTKLPILNLFNFILCLLLPPLFSSQPHFTSLLSLFFLRYSLFNISFFHFIFFPQFFKTANVQVFVKVYVLFLILGYAFCFALKLVKLKQTWSAWRQL